MQQLKQWLYSYSCFEQNLEYNAKDSKMEVNLKDMSVFSSRNETITTQTSNDHLLTFPSDRCNTEDPLEQPDNEDSSYFRSPNHSGIWEAIMSPIQETNESKYENDEYYTGIDFVNASTVTKMNYKTMVSFNTKQNEGTASIKTA